MGSCSWETGSRRVFREYSCVVGSFSVFFYFIIICIYFLVFFIAVGDF